MQYIKVLQLHDGKEHEKSYKTTSWYSEKKINRNLKHFLMVQFYSSYS